MCTIPSELFNHAAHSLLVVFGILLLDNLCFVHATNDEKRRNSIRNVEAAKCLVFKWWSKVLKWLPCNLHVFLVWDIFIMKANVVYTYIFLFLWHFKWFVVRQAYYVTIRMHTRNSEWNNGNNKKAEMHKGPFPTTKQAITTNLWWIFPVRRSFVGVVFFKYHYHCHKLIPHSLSHTVLCTWTVSLSYYFCHITFNDEGNHKMFTKYHLITSLALLDVLRVFACARLTIKS